MLLELANGIADVYKRESGAQTASNRQRASAGVKEKQKSGGQVGVQLATNRMV